LLLVACSSRRPPDDAQIQADVGPVLRGEVSLFGIAVDPSLYEVDIASISPPMQVQETPPTWEVRVEAFAVLTDPARIGRIDMRSLSDVMAMQNWVRGGGPLLQPGDAIAFDVALLYQDAGEGAQRVRSQVARREGIARRPIPSRSTASAPASVTPPAEPNAAPRPSLGPLREEPPQAREPAPLMPKPAPTETPSRAVADTPTAPDEDAATSSTRRGPSFDCVRATTPIERAICADASLAALDAELGEAYAAARQRVPTPERERLRAEQRAWIRERAARCGDPVDVACLRAALIERRVALEQGAALMAPADPDAGLVAVVQLRGQVPSVSSQEAIPTLLR
jgi:uncharacterized protein YecT (DUF1311 family)